MLDLDAYLERIGLDPADERLSAPTLDALTLVHRAHATSIPFENLGPHSGQPVSLEQDRLEDKLVGRRRGGYCFEQNLLLRSALEALGFEVAAMLARVRVGPVGATRPLTHLLLRVAVGGSAWHADAGFGPDGLLEPLPFGPGGEQAQDGWRYRVVEDGGEYVLQGWREGAWTDLYGFVPEPAVPADIEVGNWFTSTHPRSPFVTGVMIATQRGGQRRLFTLVEGEAALTERTPGGSDRRAVELASVPALLADRFGLAGVTVGPDGRLVPPA